MITFFGEIRYRKKQAATFFHEIRNIFDKSRSVSITSRSIASILSYVHSIRLHSMEVDGNMCWLKLVPESRSVWNMVLPKDAQIMDTYLRSLDMRKLNPNVEVFSVWTKNSQILDYIKWRKLEYLDDTMRKNKYNLLQGRIDERRSDPGRRRILGLVTWTSDLD